jgi:Serine dehydratase beta chain
VKVYYPFSPPNVIVGPSSSHTVGPMRAGKIFINDLLVLGLLDKVCVNRDIRSHDVSMSESPKVKTINISLYVSVLLSTKSAKMHS